MTRKFDAIIIGTGQAGPSMAARLTNAGMTVAIENDWYSAIGNGRVYGVPVLVILAIIACLILHYVLTQTRFGQTYGNRQQWLRMAILNVARSGRFSSDRTIAEYAAEIWHVKPCPVS